MALALILMAAPDALTAVETTLTNPTQRPYADEVVRLLVPAPASPQAVSEDGTPIPYQLETGDGARWIWVCSTFAPGQSHRYRIMPGTPERSRPRVTLTRLGNDYVLDNGLIAVRVAADGAGAPGPLAGMRLPDGSWVGGSSWSTAAAPRSFTAEVDGDGTILAKVRLKYRFAGSSGLAGDIPTFADIDVALAPGWTHVEISERHEMSRDDCWNLDLARGWAPKMGISRPFGGGAGDGVKAPAPERELRPGALPFCREDLFIDLLPRWNQHYKDGWLFAASDGTSAAGAVAVKAGAWIWPHQNAIEALVAADGGTATLRLPTWKGARVWWLMVGPRAVADVSQEYLERYAFASLDKLNHDFILEWPGRTGPFASENIYSGDINPTGGMRSRGRNAIAHAAEAGDFRLFTDTQLLFHPDTYGTYWNFWSPENPNFFTDFMRVPIAQTAMLRDHPRFKELARVAELRLREDLYHSVTLPGGAGQECPGYLAHALESWSALAPVCRQYLGFDPTSWERFTAARGFLERISQPDGAVRRFLPIGDTHPAKEGGPAIIAVAPAQLARFTSQELPGFGAILQNRAGTPQETYLAFKSGPNRGHYHGDQLSIHWCADATPIAVDHHCSYHPRAGQEHMHNRVAFSTPDFPYANMDGYERLIAFRTSPQADIAVGQVESARLRQVRDLPPEDWSAEYPQHRFARPLTYRRTVVLVKGGAQDLIVLRDQFWASEAITATFCLHVLAPTMARRGPAVEFGRCTLFCAAPEQPRFTSFPWQHTNGGLESTQGARLAITADHGEFITVLSAGSLSGVVAIPGGIRIGEDQIVFAGDQPLIAGQVAAVTVKRGGELVAAVMGSDIDLDRSQGEIGLFVPDAGYPFGDIPDWLIRQRGKRPAWAAAGAPLPQR